MVTANEMNSIIIDSHNPKRVSHSRAYMKNLITPHIKFQEDLVIDNLIEMGYIMDENSENLVMDYLINSISYKDKKSLVYLLMKMAKHSTMLVYDLKGATKGTDFEILMCDVCDYYNKVTSVWMKNTKRVAEINNLFICNNNVGTKFPTLGLYAFIKYTLSLMSHPTESIEDDTLYDVISANLSKFNEALNKQKYGIEDVSLSEFKAIRCTSETLSKIGIKIKERKETIRAF